MTDVTLGLRFTADQRDLQAASDKGVEAIRRLGEQAKKSNDEARKAAEQHTAALKRQADTLGMSRSQVLAYESAQHKMTEAQRQSVTASIASIDAYEKKTAMLARVRMAASLAGTAIGVALVAGLKGSVAAAAEAEQAQMRLEAVLRGTGYAAGFSGAELDKMAGRMQSRLGINDETVKKSMATLLTFRQVGRESFEDALTVAADIAAVMGTDLQSAVLQVGKALEDPEQGLTALTRSGITFNATQKDMIKEMVETGRQAEAITMILQVMKSQGLNGVAEAMNKGVTGATNDLKNSWDDFLETAGKSGVVMTPVLGTLNALTKAVKTLQQAADGGVGDALIAFATFGMVTPSVQAAPQVYADGSSETMALRRGVQVKQQEGAREKANQFLAQFKTDNQKFAEEVAFWKKTAANAGFDTEKTAGVEAMIAAKYAKKGSKESNAGAQLVLSLTEQLQQASGEGSVFDKVMRQVTEGTQKFTEAEIATALAIAGEIDERKRLRTALDQGVAAYDRDEAKRKASAAAIAGLNESLSQQAKGLQLEIDLMGATDAQREKAIALREIENKFVKARIGLDGEALAQSYEMERIERDRIAGLLDQRSTAQAHKKATEDARAEQKRLEDDLSRGLTDSIFRGFEDSKSFGRNFWDSMKNMAKTTILQPVVKYLLQPVTGAIGGVLGGMGIPGMANASGGAGGLGSLGGGGGLMSWITNGGGIGGEGGLSGMAGLMTGGFDSIFQSAGVGMGSQFIADIGNYGLGMPMIGGALQMLTGNFKGGAGTMIGGAIGSMFGPLGTMAGSAIGGLIGNSIGGKKGGPASFTGLDVSGTASMQGLLGSQFTGNSANNKQAFSWASHDHGATGGMNAMIQSAFADMGKLAKVLSLDATRLDNAQLGFSFRTTSAGNNGAGPTTQEVLDAFGQSLGQLTDQMAEKLMPNIRQFAQANETLTQTLVRLAEAQRAADLNKIFGSMQGALQLADQTRDLWLSDLSPLTAKQRLDEAQGRYGETLAKAQGGDLGAMGQLSGMARTYLSEARGYYASSADYTGIFGEVQAQIGNLVEDTLVEQSIAFSEMSIPLKSIDETIKNLDKRIVDGIESAIAARGAADEVAMRTQTESFIRATQDLGSTLKGLMAVLDRA